MHPEIGEAERFPLLTEAGRHFLHGLREHPQAPRWNWPNGEQLDAAGLERVQAFAARLQSSQGAPAQNPDWLAEFVAFCLEDVPFYRRRAARLGVFIHSQLLPRDLTRAWDFVPDSQPVEQLIVFSSSGTTGHPAKLPTHPFTAACGIPLLEHVLRSQGVNFPRGVEQMALTNLVAYPGAYTTAVVMAYLGEAGCIRVNLRAEDWRPPGDCKAFLDARPAPVLLGDPLAFAALQNVGLEQQPRAIVSSIATLTEALAGSLSARYGCPVFDLYALTEAGIVAVREHDGYRVLPPDLYVEVLDANDQPCPAGVRGEVTLTGGRNPFAPLLRYRTGDFAALDWREGRALLLNLEGRAPVVFSAAGGQLVHSMEVSRRLRKFPLAQFTLKQAADGAFNFRYRGEIDEDDLRQELAALLGAADAISLAPLPEDVRGAKVIQYERST